jgi:hypothetical protein
MRSESATADISGGDHLAAGKADRRRGLDDRHPLVVGRETDAQVQREDRLLHNDESESSQQHEGKKSGACQRASHDASRPCPPPGASDEGRADPPPISGSRPTSLGCAW